MCVTYVLVCALSIWAKRVSATALCYLLNTTLRQMLFEKSRLGFEFTSGSDTIITTRRQRQNQQQQKPQMKQEAIKKAHYFVACSFSLFLFFRAFSPYTFGVFISVYNIYNTFESVNFFRFKRSEELVVCSPLHWSESKFIFWRNCHCASVSQRSKMMREKFLLHIKWKTSYDDESVWCIRRHTRGWRGTNDSENAPQMHSTSVLSSHTLSWYSKSHLNSLAYVPCAFVLDAQNI